MNELHQVYLSLGSNIEPGVHLPKSVQLLREAGQVKAVSSVWETNAVGSDGPNFLNACILFLSRLQQDEVKEELIRPIEAKLGRIRNADKNAPRTIDIDVVLFDETPLNIKYWDYAFVAVPLAELIPNFEHPIRHEKLIRVAEQLQGRVLTKEYQDNVSTSKEQIWIVKRSNIVIS